MMSMIKYILYLRTLIDELRTSNYYFRTTNDDLMTINDVIET